MMKIQFSETLHSDESFLPGRRPFLIVLLFWFSTVHVYRKSENALTYLPIKILILSHNDYIFISTINHN